MTSIKNVSLIALFVLNMVTTVESLADISVTVDRVRWKKRAFTWEEHPDYPEWKNAGIWTEYRKKIYISRYWQPNKPSVTKMFLLLPGQQGSSGASGCSNCVTGQGSTWDDGWGKGDRSKTTVINSKSLTGKLITSGYISAQNTFLGIGFNPNFNWGNSISSKEKSVQAFTNWFLKQGDYSRVDRIYLIGSSRGGTLALRMAKEILSRSGWSGVPVYVGMLDAVPNTLQDEIYTANQSKCLNPYNNSYYARNADLARYFNGVNKPHIRHIVTGAPVILDSAVHGLCSANKTWYEQSWEDLSHTQIGRCNDSEGAEYNNRFAAAGINVLFHWVLQTL